MIFLEKYIELVDKHRNRILETFEYVWSNPETGFREWKTHEFLKEQFESLGYTVTEAGNIPGFITEIDTGKEGPTIGIFGEMDGLIIPEHPAADKETGAVHACGHVAQTAALVGVAAVLKEPNALDGLCGKIRLIAVPAEEGIEQDFRENLKKAGIIHNSNGKVEFLYRGLIDGVDMSFMIHTDVDEKHAGSFNGGSNGRIGKKVTFKGVEAHAGGAPHKGVNALYAANMALSAINALRETFEDSKHIRVHPILTEGGSSVNVIPGKVSMESYVRGADMESVLEANTKVNRAIAAAAATMGATVHISDKAGSWPRWTDRVMAPVFKKAMETVLEKVDVDLNRWGTGCSDMGDIGSLMPTVQGYVGGAKGIEHGNNYEIFDPETACVDSAKVQIVALRMFLQNNAENAWNAIRSYSPAFKTKDDYFRFKDSITCDYEAVEYLENGEIILKVRHV